MIRRKLIEALLAAFWYSFRILVWVAAMSIALLVGYSARGPFSCYFFGWEDYVPELREIGLDPAVQGVPVKKKLSVFLLCEQ